MADNKTFYSRDDIESAHQKLTRAKQFVHQGQATEAERIYRQLILDYPEYYSAHRAIAGLYIHQKKFYLAYQHLSVALGGDNTDYYSMLNMEALTIELDMIRTGLKLSEDIEHLGEKMGLKKHSDVHHFNKGSLLLKNHEYAKAIIEFKWCLKSKPLSVEPALKLIKCYRDLGNYTAGLIVIEKFIKNKKVESNQFIYALSDFPAKFIKKNVRRYLFVAEKITPSNHEEKIGWTFSIAKLYHINGDYKKAWDKFCLANEMVKDDIKDKFQTNSQWEKEILSWAKNTDFKKTFFTENSSNTQPLYILGPSRSGKTSLEKALGWIPGIRKGLESKILSDSTAQAFNVGNRLPSGYLPHLPDELIPEFVNFYRSSYKENAQDSSIYTVTTPGLVTSVPSILSALPNAKFIFMKRNVHDIALRMFFTHYSNANYHSYDYKWCLNYVEWYYKLVDVWQNKFPDKVILIDYKTLVNNSAEQLKVILAFLEIEKPAPVDFGIPNDIGVSEPYLALIRGG
ncbi:MAG: hypothetical protein COB22_06515 [Cycloclasticus sp.]|nr:MAG: hypothetical protein COB22_06515 [Cycloclasticus sp.]